MVPFRAKEHLLNALGYGKDCVPLIWMDNIDNGRARWSLHRNKKQVALQAGEKTNRLCIPNSNYVLVKRFSAKEGKRRLNAGVFIKRWLKVRSIAIENHVNYIYKVEAKLTEDEAYGLAEIFNSRLYNMYFQMSNGSTQVDASELNRIPLPALDLIARIGRYIRHTRKDDSKSRQRFVMTTLGIAPEVINRLIN